MMQLKKSAILYLLLIKSFVRVHCFGTMAGIFFIYGDEGHKQNLYKKFNFDSDELRKKIEDIL